MNKKAFFKVKGSVLEGHIVGFYKTKGLAAKTKSGKCRHVSCGATSAVPCNWFINKRGFDEMVAKGVTSWGTPLTATIKKQEEDRLNYSKQYHANCHTDWCTTTYGLRPHNVGEHVQCTRLHFEPYNDAELADPNVKPESVAIELKVALTDVREIEWGVALYDLMEDKWFSDSWWTSTGYRYKNLMPHKHSGWPAPKELNLIDQVLDSLKKTI